MSRLASVPNAWSLWKVAMARSCAEAPGLVAIARSAPHCTIVEPSARSLPFSARWWHYCACLIARPTTDITQTFPINVEHAGHGRPALILHGGGGRAWSR